MSEQPELELKTQEISGNREPRRVWHLVTNQLNLM